MEMQMLALHGGGSSIFVLGFHPVQQHLLHIMHQDGGDQQAPVPAPGCAGDGVLLGDGLPTPPQVHTLDNMGSIGAVVTAITNVCYPRVLVLEGMVAKINIFDFGQPVHQTKRINICLLQQLCWCWWVLS